MTERLLCAVPFCRRTWKGDGWATEWICQRHWSALSRERRRAYLRQKRRWRHGDYEAFRRAAIMWRALRRQAIERAVGL